MNLLILDFLRRRLWLMLAIAVLACLGMVFVQHFLFGAMAIVALLIDAQRGALRAVRPLPVRRSVQAATWWIIGVMLPSIVTAIGMCAGALIFQADPFHIPIPENMRPDSIWFMVGIGIWVSIGGCALTFLLCTALPTRMPSGFLEKMWAGILGTLWGGSLGSTQILFMAMPKSYQAIRPWHWVVFALVPVLFLASILSAPDLLRRRMTMLVATPKSASDDDREKTRGGAEGWRLVLSVLVGRTALMLLAIAGIQCVFFGILGSYRGDATSPKPWSPMLAYQVASFGALLSTLQAEIVNMRTLRTLPLARHQVTGLLLAAPVALGFLSAAFVALAPVHVGGFGGLANFILLAIYLVGVNTLALAVNLQFSSGWRIAAIMATLLAAGGAFVAVMKFPAAIAAIGVGTLVAAFALIQRRLRMTGCYHERRAFGMNFGQPAGNR